MHAGMQPPCFLVFKLFANHLCHGEPLVNECLHQPSLRSLFAYNGTTPVSARRLFWSSILPSTHSRRANCLQA